MGILDTAAEIFRFSKQNNVSFTSSGSIGLASDFTTTLKTLVGPSVGFREAGEAQAYSVPPVARAAQLYATAAAKVELKDAAGNPPVWLAPGYTALTPGGTMSALVLSLFFHGKAVCFTGRDDAGNVTSILPLPTNDFTLDMFGRVLLKGALVDQTKFIFIRSVLGQGLLEFGADSITHYLGLRDSILSRSRNPIPVVELKLTDNFTASPKEITDAQTAWQVARSATNGAVALTPAGIDVVIHGDKADTSMLSEARNEVRKDVANFANMNSSLLEGNNGQSDTYSNTLQDKDEFVDLSLDTFLVPIEQRFSQLDISPGGKLTFDRAAFRGAVAPAAQGNAGTATEDAPVSLRMKEDQ